MRPELTNDAVLALGEIPRELMNHRRKWLQSQFWVPAELHSGRKLLPTDSFFTF